MKKAGALLLVGALCAIMSVGMIACGGKQPQPPSSPQYAIYLKYQAYAESAGIETLTYEQWLASIKGATGATGATGAAGDKGDPGAPGTTWLTGNGAPASSAGKVGDFYFDQSSADIYYKDAASWSKILSVKGEAGKDGATWFTGAGAPASGVGKEGDLYLDEDSANVYKKTSGGWGTPIANLQGIAGTPGTPGTPGQPGEDGQPGADGATWLAGTGVPAADLGKAGDLYLKTDTSDVYLKTADGWGAPIANLKGLTGESGQAGADGTDGANWFFGESVPTDVADAKIGDMYLDTATCFVYNNTAAGWVKIAELKGAQGETGATGLGIQSIEQVQSDRWGIVTKTVITMTDGVTVYEFANDPDPKYYRVYDAATESELRYLLGNHVLKILLTEDVALTASLEITDDCELDLGGYTVSYDKVGGNAATIRGNGVRVEVGIFNGTVIRTGSDGGRAVEFTNKAIGSLEDVVLTCEAGYGVCVYNGASMTMTNANVVAKWHAVGTNNLMGGARIKVENSVLKSTGDVAMFLSSFTVTSVNRSTLEGNYALHIMMGDVSVTNSKLIAHSAYDPYTPDTVGNSGTKETEGAAIVIRTNLYYDRVMKTNDLSLNFANNSIATDSGVAVSLYNANDKGNMLKTYTVDGVKYDVDQSTVVDTYAYASRYLTAMSDANFVVEEYVYEAGEGVAVWTEAQLIKALAGNAATVRLLKDIDLDNRLQINRTVALDLGGHTLSLKNPAVAGGTVQISGVGATGDVTVTVQNGKIVKANYKESKAVQIAGGLTYKVRGVLNNVEIDSDSSGVVVFQGTSLIMTGCTVRSELYAISTTNGLGGKDMVIDVKDSTLTSSNGAAVYTPAYATYLFDNCEITGLTGMNIMMGDVTVKNSAVTATNATYNPYTVEDLKIASGAKAEEGSAISVRANYYYDGDIFTNELKLNLVGNTYAVANTQGVKVSLYDCGDYKGMLAAAKDQSTVVDQFGYAYEYFKDIEKDDPSFVVSDLVYSNGAFGKVVEVGTAEELQAALTAGKSVSLTADVETTNLYGFEFKVGGNVNVIGNGFTVKNTKVHSKEDPNNDARVFNIDAELNTGITKNSIFKFYDVKMSVNAVSSRGINFRRIYESKIYLTKCDVLASYYALNFRAFNDQNTMVIKNSTIMGWAAVNSYATNSDYYFVDSTMSGLNDKAPGPSNDFTVICIDGGCYPAHGSSPDCSFGMKIVAKNTNFIATVRTPSNPQTHVSFQYGAHDNTFDYDEACKFQSITIKDGNETTVEGIVVDKVYGGENNNFVNGVVIERQYPSVVLEALVISNGKGSKLGAHEYQVIDYSNEIAAYGTYGEVDVLASFGFIDQWLLEVDKEGNGGRNVNTIIYVIDSKTGARTALVCGNKAFTKAAEAAIADGTLSLGVTNYHVCITYKPAPIAA